VISVMSNLVPGAIVEMVAAHRRGDRARASGIGARLAPLFKLVGVKVRSSRQLPDGRTVEVEDRFRNPVPLKTMMVGLGLIGGGARPPLGRMTRAAVELCRDALRAVFREAPELLRPVEPAFEVDVAARLGDDAVWSALAV
jgi:dihydrodipicolinate synthase/N-acetylneuraminate lyase